MAVQEDQEVPTLGQGPEAPTLDPEEANHVYLLILMTEFQSLLFLTSKTQLAQSPAEPNPLDPTPTQNFLTLNSLNSPVTDVDATTVLMVLAAVPTTTRLTRSLEPSKGKTKATLRPLRDKESTLKS